MASALVGSVLLAAPASAASKMILPIPLGSTSDFAVLAGASVSNTGKTPLAGNLGISPGTAVTGYAEGISLMPGSTLHLGDSVSENAQIDLVEAIRDATSRELTAQNATALYELGETTFLPGVYGSSTSMGITGEVTLDGGGNENAVFLFRMGTTLTTASASNIRLINGAHARNVFWMVGTSATLGTTSSFVGTILAKVSITATTDVSVRGRLLANTGSVTFDSNPVAKVTAVVLPGADPLPGTPPVIDSPPMASPPPAEAAEQVGATPALKGSAVGSSTMPPTPDGTEYLAYTGVTDGLKFRLALAGSLLLALGTIFTRVGSRRVGSAPQ